jgi:amino acid transporter
MELAQLGIVVISITGAILIFIAKILPEIQPTYQSKFLRRCALILLLSTTAAFFSLLREEDIKPFLKALNDNPWILTFVVPLLLIALLIAILLLTFVELPHALRKRRKRRKRRKSDEKKGT